jgi:Acetyltransferase (GNAT) domain
MAHESVVARTERSGVERGLTTLATWKPDVVRLRYSLSYVKLFERTFKALQDGRSFDPDRVPSARIEAPADAVPEPYDVLVVRQEVLSGNIAVVERLPTMLRYAPRQLLHYYTDLRGGPDRAFSGMSSKTRSTVQRKVRNYEKFCGGAIRWQAYAAPGEMREYYAQARQIAAKTYQERLFESGLPDTEEFRTRMMELSGRDLVRGFLLFHGDNAIAYLYTPAPDGFLVYDYLGYDPAYAQHSPGTVLQYLALGHLYAERRFPLYYWGFGYSQTKQIFSTGQVLAADIYYFRPTLRNRLAVWLHYGTDRLSEKTGAMLTRLRLKERIKRWLRAR